MKIELFQICENELIFGKKFELIIHFVDVETDPRLRY
jgi:hypothetical protein